MAELFSFIDLFSGIGGFKIALENNGGSCLGYSEINADAIGTYCKNYNEDSSNNLGDITKIKVLPKHDLLTAGVPCQSWSIAGRNLGFDDDRGQLWNDTIYFLQKSQPKAFIFENVKGLADPRNSEALSYILNRIKDAGYYADHFVINSHDYGIPQSRVRVYIIGFKEKCFFNKFTLPSAVTYKIILADILGVEAPDFESNEETLPRDLFGDICPVKSMSLSNKNGFNDYFLFNDLRNGDTTLHSWDIIDTTERQKDICYLLLRNRRKRAYGKLDGNPLSLAHFQALDPLITQKELNELIQLEIIKEEEYLFFINKHNKNILSHDERICIDKSSNRKIIIDELKANREIKLEKISVTQVVESLKNNEIIKPVDKDTYKRKFIEEIYNTKQYRKITKDEACLIQGFPKSFILPDSRARWMKLVGNSVSIPVIDKLCKAILQTGVFQNKQANHKSIQQTVETVARSSL
ncbi:MAG: DNA cytosine methyltransferase [Gammaproteobacteria bacterium]|nr:DNA cytosine methyltransferase [Gammaproteobacteria bacterium]